MTASSGLAAAAPGPGSQGGQPFTGTWYIMPTTFEPDGSLDLASQRMLTQAVLDWGAEGITVLGVMGEASALDTGEREAVIRTVVGAAAGLPVAVGASASGGYTAAANIRQAVACGAVAAMVSAPTLQRNADALPAFYAGLREREGFPLIVQGRAGRDWRADSGQRAGQVPARRRKRDGQARGPADTG